MIQAEQRYLITNYRISQYSPEVAFGHGDLDGPGFAHRFIFNLGRSIAVGLGHGHGSSKFFRSIVRFCGMA